MSKINTAKTYLIAQFKDTMKHSYKKFKESKSAVIYNGIEIKKL